MKKTIVYTDNWSITKTITIDNRKYFVDLHCGEYLWYRKTRKEYKCLLINSKDQIVIATNYSTKATFVLKSMFDFIRANRTQIKSISNRASDISIQI